MHEGNSARCVQWVRGSTPADPQAAEEAASRGLRRHGLHKKGQEPKHANTTLKSALAVLESYVAPSSKPRMDMARPHFCILSKESCFYLYFPGSPPRKKCFCSSRGEEYRVEILHRSPPSPPAVCFGLSSSISTLHPHSVRGEVLRVANIGQSLRPCHRCLRPEMAVVSVQHLRETRGSAGRSDVRHHSALLVVAHARHQPSQVAEANNLLTSCDQITG